MFQKIMESFRTPEQGKEYPENMKAAMEKMDGAIERLNNGEMDQEINAMEKQG